MKGPITSLVIGCLALFSTYLSAQPTFSMSPQTFTANAGDNITVNFTVSNFTNIISFQYSMNWNPAVLQYQSPIGNVTTQLMGFTSANFGTTNTGSGQMTVSWFDPNVTGVSLPNGTVLYSLTFKLLTTASTTISFSGNPTVIEVINGNGNNVASTTTFQGASVNSGGGGSGGGSGGGGGGGGGVTGFAVIASDEVAASGATQVCVEVSVNDFDDIVSMQYTMEFDETKWQYTGVTGFNLTDLTAANFGTAQVGNGLIGLSWLDQSTQGISVADGTVIYQVCFTATGPNNCGTTTPFQFNSTLTPAEVTNGNGQIVAFQSDPGALEICGSGGGGGGGGGTPTGFTFYASQDTAANGSQVCVDFLVHDFDCIVSAQYSIHFNQSVLQYVSAQGFNLPDLSASNFGITGVGNGTISLSWFDQSTTGQSVPDGTVIFQLCFNVIGSNGQTSPITFNGNPTAIEATGCNSVVLSPSFISGSVFVGAVVDPCTGPLVISSPVVTNVNCFGQSTGGVNITVTGGAPQKTYVWKNNAGVTVGTSEDLANVPAGTYTVTVTSCTPAVTATGTYTVTQPASGVSINFQVTNAACFNESTGAIDLTVSGGSNSGAGCSGYTYIWSNSATTQDLSGLAAGNYKVTVTDCKGCQATSSMDVIGSPAAFTSSATPVAVTCFGTSTGSIVVSSSGGVSPYEYQLGNNAWGSASTFNNLAAGTYSVKSRDALGCLKTNSVIVTGPTADIVITLTPTSPTVGNNDGSIQNAVTGGTAPYTYSWTGACPVTPPNIEDPTNLCPGTYTVVVTDFKGCTKSKSVLVASPLAESTTNPSSVKHACFGQNNGGITLNMVGGSGNYTYQWSGGLPAVCCPQSISPGTYNVTVTDTGTGQTFTKSFNVFQGTSLPSIVSATEEDPTSSSVCDGSVTVNQAMGGFGAPYTYAWSNGGTGSVGANFCELTDYTVTVSDANGCKGTATYQLDYTPPPFENLFFSATESCSNESSGSITVSFTGAVGPFDYQISGPTSVAPVFNWPSNTYTFNNLGPGAYSVTITDAGTGADQQTTDGMYIVEATVLSIDPIEIYPATATQPGKIVTDPDGGQIPYKYQWSNGSTAQNPSNLPADCYDVTISDDNGCDQVFEDICVGLFTASTDVEQPDCPNMEGTITATATGSSNTPFTYEWSNNQSGPVLEDEPGTYVVTITDALGVSFTQTIELAALSNLGGSLNITSNFSGYAIRCFGGENGAATVVATDGVASYSYLWSNGETTSSVSNLSAGTISVTVTDAQDCSVQLSAVLTSPSKIDAETEGVNLGCSSETNTGQATVIPTGGIGQYNYQWSNGQNGPTATLLNSGSYKVTVTDANGCTLVETVSIPDPSNMEVLSASVPDSGGPNGQAVAVVTGGTWPYEFQWKDYPDQDSILSEVFPGNYFVVVTDANGCAVSKVIVVENETVCGQYRSTITPEGDGFNEEFIIGCLSRFSDNTLEIYNRWGQLVYNTKNYNDGNLWKGLNTRGDQVPDGVYFFVFDYLDPATNSRQNLKGSVTVLRK